jgi:crotonobetainyl-CoA:carnitine CoA-transferase CaiB-like acyl-CoA transferase
MTAEQPAAPRALACAGLTIVEVALGTSDLGLGMAGGVPGMVLGDLGANVTRVVDPEPAPLDRDLAWSRAWHRDKQMLRTADTPRIRSLLANADVALVYGSEERIEQNGLGYAEVSRSNPSLIYARCRPSRTARGTVEDYGLLVEAQSGFCSQLQGHRPGPIFVDVRAAGAGAAFLITTSVLALLRRRALTGLGGWTETSLYEGMLATLGTMIGRSEHAPEHVEAYWEKGSTFPNFMYRCADGELIQVWFGAKGMYEKLIAVLGDEPSSNGYYSDQVTGVLNVRAVRWRTRFAERPRHEWMARLRAEGVACEPVLAPGDALSDPHLAAIGLAVERHDGGNRDTVVGSVISVVAGGDAAAADRDRASHAAAGGLLAGVHVLDFSAFVAGPLSAQVLADMGADVIKVEPPEGEVMRAAAYAVAACQRGKRSIAIDVTAPQARPVVERLIRWADVVLHNFRVGVSSRLGIDEATVMRLNPSVVYCHASAFGASGPRAAFPGNDALMQALTGFERAVGGAGNEPLAATWIPIDMAGGWVSAAGILAGLYARAKQQRGQLVTTSLLGAGMLLQSGVYRRNGEVVRQPELDGGQTGYGPGYRIYACADGKWLAVVIPDPAAWARVANLPECAGLPADYVPLRRSRDDVIARSAEEVLQGALASAPAPVWLARLRHLGVLVEVSESIDRDQFRRRILDDPLNQQLGRVTSYEVRAWGNLDQIGILLRSGPHALPTTHRALPDVGEHSAAVLGELGFEQAEIHALLDAKVVRQFH